MEITIPYKYTPRPYQLDYHASLDGGIKRAIVVLHRRAGKTLMLWQDTIKRAISKMGLYYFVEPTYEMCKKIIWNAIDSRTSMKMLDYIPPQIIKSVNASELNITLINGSIIQLVGSENYDRLRGTNPIDIKFDEYAEQRPEVWETLRPILAENGGSATFSFTPKGMNHAWELIQKNKESDRWFVMIKDCTQTNVLSNEVIEQEKREMSQDMFDQEYMVKFLEGASQVFRDLESRVYQGEYDLGTKCRIGLDIAGHGGDYTVLTVLNANTGRVITQERWGRSEYPDSEARIEAIWRRYDKPEIVMDATGPGQPFYDYLSRKIPNVYPFTFSEKSKDQLLRNLQIFLENGKIWLNNDEELFNELRAMRYELNELGTKIKIVSPTNIHDDRVMSLALVCWQFEKVPLDNSVKQDNNIYEDNYGYQEFTY